MSSSLDIHGKYNRSLWNENDQYKKSQVDIRLINKSQMRRYLVQGLIRGHSMQLVCSCDNDFAN